MVIPTIAEEPSYHLIEIAHENHQKEGVPQIEQDEDEEPEDQEVIIPNGLQSAQIENEVVHEQDEEHEDEED